METLPTISIVMPAHNEEASLRHVVTDVIANVSRWHHEVIVVDDGSSDRTWGEIEALKSTMPQVRGIRLTRNFGHQAALVAGLRAASGAAVVMMDADGQHPAALLPTFVNAWERGGKVIQGVRITSRNEGWLKRTTSNVFYRLWSALSGVTLVRGSADFRLLDRRALDTLLASRGSLTFLRGLIPWLGYDISVVPFEAARRIAGQTSYTWPRMIRLSIDGMTAFSVVPLRLAMALGIAISAVSIAYLGYVVLVWLYSSRVVSGWASVASLVALVGGMQLFTIGVLGEYVGRIFLRTADRPEFVIAEEL